MSTPALLTVLLFMSVSSFSPVIVPSSSNELRDMFWHTCIVKSIFCTCTHKGQHVAQSQVGLQINAIAVVATDSTRI